MYVYLITEDSQGGLQVKSALVSEREFTEEEIEAMVREAKEKPSTGAAIFHALSMKGCSATVLAGEFWLGKEENLTFFKPGELD